MVMLALSWQIGSVYEIGVADYGRWRSGVDAAGAVAGRRDRDKQGLAGVIPPNFGRLRSDTIRRSRVDLARKDQ